MVAAVLLLPLAIALAVASTLPSPTPADAYRAVVVRPVGDGLDVSVTEPDAHERLLRHLTGDSLGLGPDFKLDAGHFNASGWLEVYATSPLTQDYHAARTAFVDLADPARPPVVLPSNGFLGVRWGPDGRAALVCGPAPDCATVPDGEGNIAPAPVRVLDLETGSETIVDWSDAVRREPRADTGRRTAPASWPVTPAGGACSRSMADRRCTGPLPSSRAASAWSRHRSAPRMS